MKSKLSKILTLVLSFALLCVLVLPLTGCSYCQHRLEEIQKVPATCQATGLRTAYKCVKCGKMFSYSDATGLVEIAEREVLPKSGHLVGDTFVGKPKEGGAATALTDYEVYAKCAVCDEDFKVNTENLNPFTPSENVNKGVVASYFDVDETRIGTHMTVPRTSKGTCFTIGHDNSDTDEALVTRLPFDASTDRYLVMFVQNESDVDVTFKYGAENNGERCTTDEITVPANGFTSFQLTVNFSSSSYRSWHELYIMQDLSSSVTLSFCGYYYATNKLKSISIQKYGKTEFAIGEMLDVGNIVVIADFGENVTRALKPDEYTVYPSDRPLTEEDTEVVITYKNKTVKYAITVKRFYRNVTLVGATFADGSFTKAVEQGQPLPDGITMNRGKEFDHWIDVYGNSYTEYTVGDSDITLKAVYTDSSSLPATNLARGILPTTSETGFNPTGFPASAMTDGVKSGYNAWGSNMHGAADSTVWVQIDLGEVYGINQILLFPRNADGCYFPEDYYIEVSADGVNFTKVFAMACDRVSVKNGKETRHCFFTAVDARYVRITATKLTYGGGGAYYCDYGEIEVYYA